MKAKRCIDCVHICDGDYSARRSLYSCDLNKFVNEPLAFVEADTIAGQKFVDKCSSYKLSEHAATAKEEPAAKKRTKAQKEKEERRKEALVKILKNTRISKTLKSALVMHAKIVGHYYTESEQHVLALGDDLIKLGEKIKAAAKEIK